MAWDVHGLLSCETVLFQFWFIKLDDIDFYLILQVVQVYVAHEESDFELGTCV